MLINFSTLFKKYNIQSKGVLHVGANEGQEAEEYHKNGIESVVWIEAIPEVYEKLCDNTERFENTACILACVSDVDGQLIKFNVSNNDGQSSSMLEFGTHKDVHPTVEFVRTIEIMSYRLDTLIKSSGIAIEHYNFLNIDLQGAELKALKGLGMYLHGFDYAYLEVNKLETYIGCALVEEVDQYMERFDFMRVETTTWVGNTWADAFYVKKKFLEL